MKKICFCATVALFFLASATLSAVETETADTYEPTAIPLPKKKKPNAFLSALFNMHVHEPLPLADFSLFRYNYFETKAVLADSKVIFYPQDNEVGMTLETKQDRVLAFNRLGLQKLRIAFEDYETEFTEKTLVNKKTKNAKKYGEISARYTVGHLLGDIEYKPEVTCGYIFVEQSPYFIITIPETKSTLENPVDSERTRTSKTVKLLFNRSQMKTFLEQASEENISQAVLNATAQQEASESEQAAETESAADDVIDAK